MCYHWLFSPYFISVLIFAEHNRSNLNDCQRCWNTLQISVLWIAMWAFWPKDQALMIILAWQMKGFPSCWFHKNEWVIVKYWLTAVLTELPNLAFWQMPSIHFAIFYFQLNFTYIAFISFMWWRVMQGSQYLA